MGRRKFERLTDQQRAKLVELLTRGEMSKTAAAVRFGISRHTIQNIMHETSAGSDGTAECREVAGAAMSA